MTQTAAPGLAWEYYRAPDFLHQKAASVHGTWFLDHPDDDGLIRIGFQPRLPQRVTREALLAALRRSPRTSRHYWQAASLLGHHTACMGYAASRQDARRLIDRLDTAKPKARAKAVLRAASFVATGDEPERHYEEFRRSIDGGDFVLRLSPTAAHLRFHPRASKGWINLMRLITEKTMPDPSVICRYFWPPTMMQNFSGIAAVAAADLVEDFIGSGRTSRKGRDQAKRNEKALGLQILQAARSAAA